MVLADHRLNKGCKEAFETALADGLSPEQAMAAAAEAAGFQPPGGFALVALVAWSFCPGGPGDFDLVDRIFVWVLED